MDSLELDRPEVPQRLVETVEWAHGSVPVAHLQMRSPFSDRKYNLSLDDFLPTSSYLSNKRLPDKNSL